MPPIEHHRNDTRAGVPVAWRQAHSKRTALFAAVATVAALGLAIGRGDLERDDARSVRADARPASANVRPQQATGTATTVASSETPTLTPSATPTVPTLTPTQTPTLPAWTPNGAWRPVHAPGREPLWTRNVPRLNAVHGLTDEQGESTVWAVGDDCAVVRYTDGTWAIDAEAAALCNGSRAFDLRDVFVREADEVWVVGAYTGGSGLESVRCVEGTPESREDADVDEGCGMVMHRRGGEWHVFRFADFGMNVPVPALNALDMMYDPDTEAWMGFAAGNDNADDTLKALILDFVAGDDRQGADGAWLVTSRARTNIGSDLRDVRIVTPVEAWMVGEFGNEPRFAPGREIWSASGISGVDHLYAVDLTDIHYGWDGGQRGRMNHYDGNCHDGDTATPCWFDNRGRPVRLLPEGSTVSSAIRAIALQARGRGWLAGDLIGRRSYLAYLQPDETWYVPELADDPGEDLFGLYFANHDRGWAVGDHGTILGYTVPEPTATSTSDVSATATLTVTATSAATSPATGTLTPEATPVATATSAATASAVATVAVTATSTATVGATTTQTATSADATPTSAATTATATRTPGPAVTERIYLPFGWRRAP